MHYHFKYRREAEGGFSAECIELDGCRSQGETLDELKANLAEALNLYLDEPSDSKAIFPMPRNKKPPGSHILQIQVEPSVAFAFLLRTVRLQKGLTQKKMQQELGFKNIWSYQRLERATDANPELKTIIKIADAFPSMPWAKVFKRA